MSTRATYKFHDRGGLTTTVYIHHDGYPGGAACYLYRALCRPSKGNLATQFVRANDRAELTRGHEQHADTDYRYDLFQGPDGDFIKTEKRYGHNTWRYEGQESLYGFCAQHHDHIAGWHANGEPGEWPSWSPFREVQLSYRIAWLNVHTAREYLEAPHGPLNHLATWKKSGGAMRGSANWDHCEREVKSIAHAFPELVDAELAEFCGAELGLLLDMET